MAPRSVVNTIGREVAVFRARHGMTQEAFGKLVDPPLTRHKVCVVETAEFIAPGMAARVREAMRRHEKGSG